MRTVFSQQQVCYFGNCHLNAKDNKVKIKIWLAIERAQQQ